MARELKTGLAGAFHAPTPSRRPHAATDDRTHRVDELQVTLGAGPAVEAGDGLATVYSGDLSTERRWPGWSAQAASHGVRSMICTRIISAGSVVSSLQAYSDTPHHFSPSQAAICEAMVLPVALAVHASVRERDLDLAVASHTLVGQAQGIIMERFGVDADQAFHVLRRYSQTQNTKLTAIAHDLVTTGHLPDTA